jgi:hypothetical protein
MTKRLYFIDAIRVAAVLILLVYHSGLVFSGKSHFHIKNDNLSMGLEYVLFFFHEWRLGLLFFVSGVGTCLALKKRRLPDYAKERFKRLFVPLIFGVLVIVPPQIYVERLFNGFDYGGYWAFYAESFTTGFYPSGNISWHHLWFVAYLLIYALASLPFFNYWAKHSAVLLPKIRRFTEGAGLWLAAMPLMLVMIFLKKHFIGVQNIVHDGAFFLFYGILFLFGFIAASADLWYIFERQRWAFLTATIWSTTLVYTVLGIMGTVNREDTGLYEAFSGLRAFNAWSWIVVICGYAKRFFDSLAASEDRATQHFLKHILPRLNEAVYPFYILHQTAILLFGYWVVGLPLGMWFKFGLVVFLSFAACVVVYWGLIRPFASLRFFFGMPMTHSLHSSPSGQRSLVD